MIAIALSLFSTWWLNLAAATAASPHFQADSFGYWQLAEILSSAGAFTSLTRTPLYPAFLAWFAQLSLTHAILAQTLLTWLIIYGTYDLTRNAEGERSRAPALAALLTGASFNVNAAAGWILTETLFTLLLVAMGWAILRATQSPHRYRFLLIAGLLCGVLALCRPIATYLGIVLVGGLFANSGLRNKPAGVLIFVLCGALLPVMWAARNYAQTGNFTFSTIAATNLYEYRAAWIIAQSEHIAPEVAQAKLIAQLNQEIGARPLTEAARARLYTQKALRIMAHAPLLTLRQGLEGLARIFFDLNNFETKSLCHYLASRSVSRDSSVLAQRYAQCKAGLMSYQILFLLAIYLGIGLLAMSWRTYGRDARVLIGLAVGLVGYFALLSAGIEANARFRMPVEPFLCVLSGLGWSRCGKLWRPSAVT